MQLQRSWVYKGLLSPSIGQLLQPEGWLEMRICRVNNALALLLVARVNAFASRVCSIRVCLKRLFHRLLSV